MKLSFRTGERRDGSKYKYPLNRDNSFKEGDLEIDRIRGEIVKDQLESGRHWIILKQDIPMAQITSEELDKAIVWLVDNGTEEQLSTIEFYDLLNDKRYTFKETIDKRNLRCSILCTENKNGICPKVETCEKRKNDEAFWDDLRGTRRL